MTQQEIILSGLHPCVREQIIKVLAKLESIECPCLIESGYRSYEAQQNLYNLGRSVKNPNGSSSAMPLGHIVTNAMPGFSWHNFGLAADVTRVGKDGKKTWELPYKPIGDIGKEFGFEWGGDWRGDFKDLPHLDMKFGFTLAGVQDIVKVYGLKGLWDRIDQKNWV